MSNQNQNGQAVRRTQDAVHEGLRSFLISTFNYMAAGVTATAIVAWFFGAQFVEQLNFLMGESSQPAMLGGIIQVLYFTPIKWALVFAPLGLSFLFGGAIWTARPAVAHAMFWTFAVVFALAVTPLIGTVAANSVSTLFLAFLMSAFGFLSLSIYGYVTKADLTSWGTFGRVGIMVAIVGSLGMFGLSMFGFGGEGFGILSMVINVVVAVASLALTAFSIQMLKGAYFSIVQGEWADATRTKDEQLESAGIAGALALYINFMNLFMSLLSLLRGGD